MIQRNNPLEQISSKRSSLEKKKKKEFGLPGQFKFSGSPQTFSVIISN